MNLLFKLIFTSLLAFTLGTSNSMAQTPTFPSVVYDDNGHYGFVREIVPLLLGRKPRGAREVKLLGDIAELSGRAKVIRLLMTTPEFNQHWSDTFLDMLRLQRSGIKKQRQACFENPMLSVVSGSLADFVADSTPTSQWSSSNFNMKDIALSSFKADRIDALQRAYLYPFTMNGGRNYDEEVYKASQGVDFSHTYLNRNTRCFSCHNEQTSTSDTPSWDRHWPINIWSDKVLFGSSAPGDAGKLNNVFRFDQAGDSDDSSDGKMFPWGIHDSCVTDSFHSGRKGFVAVGNNNDQDVSFAGEDDNNIGIEKIDQVLKQGISSLKSNGLQLTPGGQNAFPEPSTPEQALAFTVAVSTVNMVWSKLMGENLTVSNYFPRNQSQRDALWNLTIETFIPQWSIKSLIETILLSTYTARKSPEVSTQLGAYKLPMIIDPWVARDPRGNNPPQISDLNTHNGQGEIVRAHTKRTAMRQASKALGIPPPNLYGNTGGRYDSEMQLEFGQFLSTSQPGLEGFDIQALLTWEDTNGLCQNSAWMARLMDSIAAYDMNNPLLPLSLLDVVKTIRDWLLQDARVEINGSMAPDSHELAALAAIFSVNNGQPMPMSTPVATFKQFTSANEVLKRFSQVCGAYISSPQFLMTGISLSQPLEIPNFLICNEQTESCGYQEMCEDYRTSLSTAHATYIQCNEDSVVPEDPPASDPGFATLCQYHEFLCEDNLLPPCFDDIFNLVDGLQSNCGIDIDRCDPRCGSIADIGLGRFGIDSIPSERFGILGGGELGLRCCGGMPDIDLRLPDDVISWLEGGLIIEAQGVLVVNLYEPHPQTLNRGDKLKFGDVLAMPPGSRLLLELNGEKIDIGGKHGVSSIFARSNSLQFRKGLTELMDNGDNRIVRKMLKRGLSTNSIMPSGESLLNWAIRRGDQGLGKELIEEGADINRVDARGNSPLTSAHEFERRDMIRILEKYGALPYEKENYSKQQLPHKLVVTGPSAAKAPHPSGERYFSEIQWRDLKVQVEPQSLEDQKRHVYESRKINSKRGEYSFRNRPDNADLIVEFPLPDRDD